MLFHDGNEGKYQTDVLAAAETTIQTAMKHREMRPEFNQCLGQTRRGGYCVLCGRHFVPVTKKRICLHCKEELEELEFHVERIEPIVIRLLENIPSLKRHSKEYREHVDHLIRLLHKVQSSEAWHAQFIEDLDYMGQGVEKLHEFIAKRKKISPPPQTRSLNGGDLLTELSNTEIYSYGIFGAFFGSGQETQYVVGPSPFIRTLTDRRWFLEDTYPYRDRIRGVPNRGIPEPLFLARILGAQLQNGEYCFNLIFCDRDTHDP
ncbi:MAG: hypothetical protein HW384_1000, partial [Dehalococcoidia bacterium]|nr:hypothetical protein [Dehalococcoidia bacterium]